MPQLMRINERVRDSRDKNSQQNRKKGERCGRMTELARTSARMKELFEVVDLEPLPQSQAAARVLDYWTSKRGGRAEVPADEIDPAAVSGFASYIIIYEAGDTRLSDYRLTYAGKALGPVLGEHGVGELLSSARGGPYAERAHHLFGLSLDRGEPVTGIFQARFAGLTDLYVEMLAAPIVAMPNGERGIFGAIAYRHLEHGWEDQPSTSA